MDDRRYENKAMDGRRKSRPAIIPDSENKRKKSDGNIKVEVIREHCGIKIGEVLIKPKDIALRMIRDGYYREV